MNDLEPTTGSTVHPDIVKGLWALLAGIIVFFIFNKQFHNRAAAFVDGSAYGQVMPFYQELNVLCISVPYFVSGAFIGLLTGAGRTTKFRFPLLRFIAGPMALYLFLMAYLLWQHGMIALNNLLLLHCYLPSALIGFAASLLLDWRYRALSDRREKG